MDVSRTSQPSGSYPVDPSAKESQTKNRVGFREAVKAKLEIKKLITELNQEMEKAKPGERTPEQQKKIEKLRYKIIDAESTITQKKMSVLFPFSLKSLMKNMAKGEILDNMQPYKEKVQTLLDVVGDKYNLPKEFKEVPAALYQKVENGICTGAGISVTQKILPHLNNPKLSPQEFEAKLMECVSEMKDGGGPIETAIQVVYSQARDYQSDLIVNKSIDSALENSTYVKDKVFEKDVAHMMITKHVLSSTLTEKSGIDAKMATFAQNPKLKDSELATLHVLVESFKESPHLSLEDRTTDVLHRLQGMVDTKVIPAKGFGVVKEKLLSVLFVMEEVKQDLQKNNPYALEENKQSHQITQHIEKTMTPIDKTVRSSFREKIGLKSPAPQELSKPSGLDTRAVFDFRALNNANKTALQHVAGALGMNVRSCDKEMGGERGTVSDKESIKRLNSLSDGVYGVSIVVGNASHFTSYVVRGNDRYFIDPNYGLFKCDIKSDTLQTKLLERIVKKYEKSAWIPFSGQTTPDHQIQVHQFTEAAHAA